MAWNAKPSGTAKIDRRTEPYLTAEMRARFDREIRPRYETAQGALLPILHEIQHAHRWIPHQAMLEVAEYLGLAPADVLDTTSFYEDFRRTPPGRCVIGVCQSIACEVCDHAKLLDRVRERLGIEPGETTEDGAVTVITMECLGSCDTAPVALVDETLHERFTVEQLDRILDDPPTSSNGHHGH